jgi:hypothetical protein
MDRAKTGQMKLGSRLVAWGIGLVRRLWRRVRFHICLEVEVRTGSESLTGGPAIAAVRAGS